MARFLHISLAVFCIVAVAVCGAIPRPDTVRKTTNVDAENEGGALKIAHWFRSAVATVKGRVPSNNIQGDADNIGLDYIKKQDNIFKAEEDSLPFLHNEDTESGNAIIPASLSNKDKVNPFVRSKRSACAINPNLPQMLRDLNAHLNVSQYIGLNPEEPTPQTTPARQHYTCPNTTTNSWWPQHGDNLRSTCPWTIERINLGDNAFPRYVDNAICMCQECLNSTSMRCTEVTFEMTYFVRQEACENGLAVMVQNTRTVNVGCHCVGPNPPIANHNTQ